MALFCKVKRKCVALFMKMKDIKESLNDYGKKLSKVFKAHDKI
jgi:hypothetical protein